VTRRTTDGPSIGRAILGQARPIFVGQVAAMAFAVVDTVLSGTASSVDLATMGLGLSVYSTVFIGLLGATSALNPIVAQHFGGGRLAAIGATYVQGLWMALGLSALGMLPLLLAGLWLPWLHAPSEVETQVARYLRVLALALPGALMFRAIYAVNTAVSRPHVVMSLQLTGLAIKVCLSYVLILGGLGLHPMGRWAVPSHPSWCSGCSSCSASATCAAVRSIDRSSSTGTGRGGPSCARSSTSAFP
jgi:MATE family multidrug resistance protein